MYLQEAKSQPVSAAFEEWKQIYTRIEELERGEQDKLRLVDLWTFQKREIEEAPSAGWRRGTSRSRKARAGERREDLQRGDERL